MNEKSWWELLNNNLEPIRVLVQQFHPASRSRSQVKFKITAKAAESVSKAFRKEIEDNVVAVLVNFDTAINNKNAAALCRILNET